MAESLKKKTVNGVFWSVIDNFATLGVSFVFNIIIARILSPEDYGTIGLLTIFIQISAVLVNSGFSSALIRKPDLNEIDKSTAFYFNIVVGFTLYFLFFLLSPFVSRFYDIPILTSLLRVTAIVVIFNSLAIVPQTELSVRIDFKKQAIVSVIGSLISGCIGLYFAYNGFGVWALAIQQVGGTFFRTVLLWIAAQWKPTKAFSVESFKYLFGFGSKLLASGLLETTWRNIYPIVIGKVYSPAQLGLYSRAQQFADIPSSGFTMVLQRVTFPVLSKMQSDEERLIVNFRRILRMTVYIIFPLLTGLAAVSKPLVLLLLGEKWSGCIIYLQILCYGMMWYPVHAINVNLLQVVGRSDLFLKLEIIKKIIGVIILLVTIPFGLTAMCYGLVVNSLITLYINSYYSGKFYDAGLKEQLHDVLPYFLISVLMSIVVFFAISLFTNHIIQLFIGIIIGFFFYYLCSKFFRFNELSELINIIKKK